ncbi:putative laccase-11, partial [Stylosanthes scabra]|nr:putative laccase-11 [Stylosanthes scabra]
TFKLNVKHGKTYLLRIINAAVQDLLFFGIAKHELTVVGTDGSYVKPLKVEYITISPGQTMDVITNRETQKINVYFVSTLIKIQPSYI